MAEPSQRRIEELFQAALEQPAADRAIWLDAHCPDSDLRREVEELLAHADAESARSHDTFASVFEVLAVNLGSMSQISLRDILGDESPIALPPGGGSGRPELPERVGRYQVAGEIARGGVGSVWKARDTELGREIALKVLLDGHEGNADAMRRFVEEAQIGAQLQHPGIVPVHDMGLVGGKKPYFAMKVVKGETLASLLARRSDPSQDRQRFLGIFEQICQPIAYAHARGVIHRDLKPSNVMVGAFGEVQVMDWGLAKVAPETRRRSPAKSATTSNPSRSRWKLTLHLANISPPVPTPCRFDVVVEGETVLESYEAVTKVGFAAADRETRVVEVRDGFLDIQLRHISEHPNLMALEIEALP